MSVVDAMDLGPLRPWVVSGSCRRRLRKDFKLDQTAAAVSQRSGDAVSAGVAASDYDHVFIFRGDEVRCRAIQYAFSICTQEIHREVNAWQVSILNRKITRTIRSAAQHNGVKVIQQSISRIIATNVGVRDELDTFGLEQIHATLNDCFVEFHVWNAVHEQAADTICFLKYLHGVA